ncbi:MAG TPA: SpoIIE family protein phosphatase, partial [Kineosporiaceae bacterium]
MGEDAEVSDVRVLVLEDESADAELAVWTLADQGVPVGAVSVASTREAFERSLDDFQPHVILSDYTVPSLNGEDALRLASQRRPDVPFIFLTGTLGEDRAVELLKAGAWDYVLKSRMAKLGPAVTRALREAAQSRVRLRLEAEREAMLAELRQSDERLRAALGQLRAALGQLQGLQELTEAFAGVLQLPDVLEVLRRVAAPALGLVAGAVILTDPGGTPPQVHCWTSTAEPTGPAGLTGPAEVAAPAHRAAGWRHVDEQQVALGLRQLVDDGRARYLSDAAEVCQAVPGWRSCSPGEACAVLPLGGARPVGVLALSWPGRRSFPDAERAFLETIAAQCRQALERARLIESQATVAHALQRALLPSDLPALPWLRSVARYLPAHGDAVGGDWYDLLTLPDGRVAMVMGDVEGHSPAASAIMGQVRNVLRAYLAEGHNAAEIMRRVNEFMTSHVDVLITCCYAEIDPEAYMVTTVSAGHPLPVVMDRSGGVVQLPVEVGLPLGLQVSAHYAEHTSVLPLGGRLVMFTDGLVDSDRAVHDGIDAFMQCLREHAGDEPDALADALVARPADAPPLPDDAALLVVELTGAAVPNVAEGRTASRTFRSTPAAAP